MHTNKLKDALQALLNRDMRNTCQHEETERGGHLWTICCSCGQKWADDRGGKPEWVDPPEWAQALAALEAPPDTAVEAPALTLEEIEYQKSIWTKATQEAEKETLRVLQQEVATRINGEPLVDYVRRVHRVQKEALTRFTMAKAQLIRLSLPKNKEE